MLVYAFSRDVRCDMVNGKEGFKEGLLCDANGNTIITGGKNKREQETDLKLIRRNSCFNINSKHNWQEKLIIYPANTRR